MTFEQFSERHQVTIASAELVGENPYMADGAEMDHWELAMGFPPGGGWECPRFMQLEFSTGKGHRRADRYKQLQPFDPCPIRDKDGRHLTTPVCELRPTAAGKKHNEECCKPVPPSIATVLECLQLDASSHEGTASFEEWADEFGLDSDSRKAHRSWEVSLSKCRELKRLLGDEAWQEFLECEED